MATSPQSEAQRPKPLSSLTASSARLKSRNIKRFTKGKGDEWQSEAWDMYDLVGEQRFLANTLGNLMGQARFFVSRLPDNPIDEPDPILRPSEENSDDENPPEPLTSEEEQALVAWEGFCRNPIQLSQLIARAGVNLFIAGDGWIAGIPKRLMNPSDQAPIATLRTGVEVPTPGLKAPVQRDAPVERFGSSPATEGPTVGLDELEWRFLSVDECKVDAQTGTVEIVLHDGETERDKIKATPEEVLLIRVWRPHPRRWWRADSPTKSSLPVLRELVGLTQHVSAQVDSRLAGAGVLLVPQSALDALKQSTPNQATDEDSDPFSEALMEAMLTPIEDRSNASALVPLTLTVPDESIEKFRFISFATELDAEARELREEALRRLALGEDCPPEVLLGVGDMNHWGAWLVKEDTITTHVEPPEALICDALTTQYLWPVLIENGMPETQAHKYVVWYSVDHLISRPNRFSDAKSVHEADALSDEALRREGGFSEEDAPKPYTSDAATNMAISIMAKDPAPFLASPESLVTLIDVLRVVLAENGPPEATDTEDGTQVPAGDESGSETPSSAQEGVPDTNDSPASPSGPEASAA